MSRKNKKYQRKLLPDPKFKEVLVSQLVNKVMLDGKKSLAERVVYGAFDRVSDKLKDDPFKIFKKALDNVKPVVEVRSRRVGGATYQVPMEVRQERRVSLALRWLVSYARDRRERSMEERLSGEILEAYNNAGNAVKKREDVHRMAEANKAFAHYRW